MIEPVGLGEDADMEVRILDKIGDWFVMLFDWWAPSPEERWAQMQELSEAKAELRQAIRGAFGTDRFVTWLAKWLDRIGGRWGGWRSRGGGG